MPGISELLDTLGQLPPWILIAAAGLLALTECVLGLGFIVPGESALLLAAASLTDFGMFVLMVAVVTTGAAIGDLIGYGLGHRYGHRLRRSKVVTKLGCHHWDRAARLLRTYGVGAVFTARFLPVVRTLTPAAAGASGLNIKRFAPAALTGAFCWSSLHISIGYAAGASARYIEDLLGRASWILLLGLLALAATILLWRRRRSRTGTPNPASTPGPREHEQ